MNAAAERLAIECMMVYGDDAPCMALAKENEKLRAVVAFVRDNPERIRELVAYSGSRGFSRWWNKENSLALAAALEALEDVR